MKIIKTALAMIAMVIGSIAISYGAGLVYSSSDVVVTAAAPAREDGGISIDVTVTFKEDSLYNEGVYLSYHILDQNGELLQFENTRYPLTVQSGRAEQTILISSADIPEEAHGEAMVFQLDLVDTQNVFWFSENGDIAAKMDAITLESAEIEGPSGGDMDQNHFLKQAAQISVIAINAAGIAGLGALLWFFRKDISSK